MSVSVLLSRDPDVDRGRQTRCAETHRLLRQARSCPRGRRQALLEQAVLLNLQLADAAAARYQHRGVALEDLQQVARLGLVKAVRGFDPAHGADFLSYAVPTIRGEVKRYFRDSAWAVRPPRRVQELQALVSATTEWFSQREGRRPTDSELAAEIGCSERAIGETRSARGCYQPTSLDQPVSDDGETLSGWLASDEMRFNQVEAWASLKPLMQRLPRRERRILWLRFFHGWTQARIADDCDLSQMQVSRIIARTLRRMRAWAA